MKKRIAKLAALLLIAAVVLCPAALALEVGDPLPDFVTDAAELLTYDEWADLDEMAEKITDKYDFPIFIITVESTEGMVPAVYAEELYDYSLDPRYDRDRSGVLLMVSMAERDVVLFTRGYGNTVFTDYGKEKLEGKYISDLSDGNYFDSFAAYINGCDRFLEYAEKGNPIDVNSDPDKLMGTLVGIIGGSLVFGFIVTSVLNRKMKSAVKQSGARAYIPNGGFNLRAERDTFSHQTVSRVKIERPSSGGGSSGGTTTSSSGSSSRSSKF